MNSRHHPAGSLQSLSILTPSYRYARFIDDAIQSIRGQDPELRVQHVVVDGGSDDGTVDVLRSYSSVTWLSEPDKGQSDALNKALILAHGEIIGWLNADEFYLENTIKRVLETFEETGADIVYGDAVHVDVSGQLRRLVAQHGFDSFVLRYYGCYVPSCSFFVRRTALSDEPWDPDCGYVMDWDLYLSLLRSGAKFAYLPEPLGAFRIHDGQVTAQPLARDAPERIRVQNRYGVQVGGVRGELLRRAAWLKRIGRKLISGSYVRERRYARMAGVDKRWWDHAGEPRDH